MFITQQEYYGGDNEPIHDEQHPCCMNCINRDNKRCITHNIHLMSYERKGYNHGCELFKGGRIK